MTPMTSGAWPGSSPNRPTLAGPSSTLSTAPPRAPLSAWRGLPAVPARTAPSRSGTRFSLPFGDAAWLPRHLPHWSHMRGAIRASAPSSLTPIPTWSPQSACSARPASSPSRRRTTAPCGLRCDVLPLRRVLPDLALTLSPGPERMGHVPEQEAVRVGSIAAVVGAMLLLVFNILHPRGGDLHDQPAQLRLIADSGIYRFDHVA